MNANDKNLRFIPIAKATTPPSGLIEHFKNCFWCVHPDKGVVFWKQSPQCNTNELITARLAASMYPWAEVRLIPSVFRKINPHDYCYQDL